MAAQSSAFAVVRAALFGNRKSLGRVSPLGELCASTISGTSVPRGIRDIFH
jgi:hypothetical protein